jgi:hypothetical protein
MTDAPTKRIQVTLTRFRRDLLIELEEKLEKTASQLMADWIVEEAIKHKIITQSIKPNEEDKKEKIPAIKNLVDKAKISSAICNSRYFLEHRGWSDNYPDGKWRDEDGQLLTRAWAHKMGIPEIPDAIASLIEMGIEE